MQTILVIQLSFYLYLSTTIFIFVFLQGCLGIVDNFYWNTECISSFFLLRFTVPRAVPLVDSHRQFKYICTCGVDHRVCIVAWLTMIAGSYHTDKR